MARLIDADVLIEAMTKFSNATGEDMTHGIFYVHIAPTIDAEPVRHGKWKSDCMGVLRCSECNAQAPWRYDDILHNVEHRWKANYCPHCGARMDKE